MTSSWIMPASYCTSPVDCTGYKRWFICPHIRRNMSMTSKKRTTVIPDHRARAAPRDDKRSYSWILILSVRFSIVESAIYIRTLRKLSLTFASANWSSSKDIPSPSIAILCTSTNLQWIVVIFIIAARFKMTCPYCPKCSLRLLWCGPTYPDITYSTALANINLLWHSDAICVWVNAGSGNGLLSDGAKPLPDPMLTHHHWGHDTIT